MKKITAFVGSPRKAHTYRAAETLLENLRAPEDVEAEIVFLADHRIEPCRGCKLRFDKGKSPAPCATTGTS